MAYKNYINERISARASRQFRRIVSGRTEIVDLRNGAEVRTAVWKHKPHSFKANFVLLSKEAQLEVSSAFHAVDAMCYLFRFRDYGDYTVTNSPLVGVVAGGKVPVQLTKRYSFGSTHSDRTIQAVVRGKVIDGADAEVAGTIDTELGLFTPTNNWGSGPYYWSGVFDVWVRFASDDLDMTMENLELATSDVELVERRAVRVD